MAGDSVLASYGLLSTIAERFVAGKNPTAFSMGERVGLITEAVRTGQVFDFIKPGETTLSREFATFFTEAAEVRTRGFQNVTGGGG